MARVKFPRRTQQDFWWASRRLGSYDEAAVAAGVSSVTARRWVRQRGGVMPDVKAPSSFFLDRDDRQEIQELTSQGLSPTRIAEVLGRHRSTIYRELARGRRPVDNGKGFIQYRPYLAAVSQDRRDSRAARPKHTKLSQNARLAAEVSARLNSWSRPSPEQIAHRLKTDYPDDESMRISHETIYTELYVQARSALKVDITSALRTGRGRRKPRRGASRPRVPGELLIANRPKDIDDRCVPGHWEGDLIIGAGNQSAIGTLVERSTRFTMLLHLPHGHSAGHVADAMARTIGDLPTAIRTSLTWDQGAELVGSHRRIATENDITIWFCDPASPWQRGTNENTNGLLRQYFPKGSDLSAHTAEHLTNVAAALNNRPRKTLHWQTPAEVMNELLSNTLNSTVATTP